MLRFHSRIPAPSTAFLPTTNPPRYNFFLKSYLLNLTTQSQKCSHVRSARWRDLTWLKEEEKKSERKSLDLTCANLDWLPNAYVFCVFLTESGARALQLKKAAVQKEKRGAQASTGLDKKKTWTGGEKGKVQKLARQFQHRAHEPKYQDKDNQRSRRGSTRVRA
jgi:hypothetical protein